MQTTMAVVTINVSKWAADVLWPVALYVGPDLILPLTSALAAIAGVLLMFWNRVMSFVRSVWNSVFGRPKKPHA